MVTFYSLYISCLIITLIARANLFSSIGYSIHLDEFSFLLFRGIGSDALIIGVFSLAALKSQKWLQVCILFLWCFLLVANSVHVTFNASNIDLTWLKYGLHKNFIFGSVLSQDILIYTALYFIIGLSFWYFLQKKNIKKIFSLTLLLIPFCFISSHELYPGWVQYNVVEEAFRKLVHSQAPKQESNYENGGLKNKIYSQYLTADLSGKPIVRNTKNKMNVILLVVEALSAIHIEKGYMPFLKKMSQKHIYLPNFISLQRITTNGMYSLWCGDFPNLASQDTKSEVLLMENFPRSCLPKILADNGYYTLFLESADLDYMDKGKLSSAVGIQEIRGGKTLPIKRSENGWGVNDGDLFDSALKTIDRIKSDSDPFFMTLLTVGTHHPYPGIPIEFLKKYPTKVEAAFAYADKLLEHFLMELKKKNVLDDTLILVTNDESAAEINPTKIPMGLLSGNRGIMLAITPSGHSHVIQDEFSQRDVLISVMDYLNIPLREGVFGRSIFRRYEHFQPQVFSNVFLKRVFAYTKPGKMISCGYGLKSCYSHSFEGELFSAKNVISKKSDSEDTQYIQNLINIFDRSYLSEDRWVYKQSSMTLTDEKARAYHMKRMSAVRGEIGEWNIIAQADSGNLSPAKLLLRIRKSYHIENNYLFVKKEDIVLDPGETLEYNFKTPLYPSGNIYDSTLQADLIGSDSVHLSSVYIRRYQNDLAEPLEQLTIIKK